MIDTRTYAQIHLNLAESIVHNDKYEEHKRLARVEMTANIVETLNDDLPMCIETLIQIVGTLIILAHFNLSYFWTTFLFISLLVPYIPSIQSTSITKTISSTIITKGTLTASPGKSAPISPGILP